MAFVDKDEYGNSLVNITNRVGLGGSRDDVVVVQQLLRFIYENSPVLKYSKYVAQVSVTGNSNSETVALIAHFQAFVMKRKIPQGYINRYSGKNALNSTIWQLNSLAQKYLLQTGQAGSVAAYLKKEHPALSSSLIESGQNSAHADPVWREHTNHYNRRNY